MGKTKIEWTATIKPDGTVTPGYSYNPWWGCFKVSPGCSMCYAETLDARYHPDGAHWGKNAPRRFFNDKHWNEPLLWNRDAGIAGKRARVFCGSMCDIFENRPDLVEPRARLFQLILDTPYLEWLLLTKRIEEVKSLVPESWLTVGFPGNVRLGTTVESQEYVYRLEILSDFNVRNFVSIEPILGAVDIMPALYGYQPPSWGYDTAIDWVIVGGESGAKARPCHPNWVRNLRDQCVEYGNVPFFFKQWGEWITREQWVASGNNLADVPDHAYANAIPCDSDQAYRVGKHAAGSLLDGVAWKQFPKETE